MGSVSGNDLNGHGDTEPRRPTEVMWNWQKQFPHRGVQELIATRHRDHPDIAKVLRFGSRDRYEPPPVAAERVERSPAAWMEAVTDRALHHAEFPVDDLGVAAIDPSWVFEDRNVEEPFAIVLVVEMDYDELATAPEWPASAEVQRAYNRGTYAARALADWIREQGYQARGHGGPEGGPLLLIPPAIEAGLGELGKHGSMIHPRLGSRFRLAVVLTDLPLRPDERRRFGADEFCWDCRVCIDACPPGAIFSTRQLVRGEEKWYVDFDRCLPYFAETYGCAVCLAVCPWSTPGEAERLVGTMSRKLARRAARETGQGGAADR